jgi:hypothetical protein
MAKIYDIGDMRVQVDRDYGPRVRGEGGCGHQKLTFDERGQTIVCDLCGKQVSAWWTFLMLMDRYQEMMGTLRVRQVEVEEAEGRVLTHKAAIAVEDAWRRRKMVPTCPHCHKGILPAEGFGRSLQSREHYGHEHKPMEFRMKPEVLKGGKAPESA